MKISDIKIGVLPLRKIAEEALKKVISFELMLSRMLNKKNKLT